MKKAGIQKPLPKPLGIPNAFPGKAEMLDQYEDHERMQAQLKKDEKTYARAMKKIGADGTMQNYPEILSSSKVIQQEKKTEGELTAQEIEEAERLMVQTGEIEAQPTKEFGISRRAYFKELERVLEDSDVILQVLDARDPESCRSEEIEAECLKRKKRLI